MFSPLYYVGAMCWIGALFVGDKKAAGALVVIGMVMVLIATAR